MDFSTLQIAATITLTFLATVGIGGISLHFVKLWTDGRREKRERIETTSAANVEFDRDSLKYLHTQLEKLQTQIQTIQTKLEEQTRSNADLSTANALMKQVNDSQTTEIEKLRLRTHTLSGQIQSRDKEVLELKMQVKAEQERNEDLRHTIDAQSRQLAELERQLHLLLKKHKGEGLGQVK